MPCVNMIRYTLLLFILISSVTVLVVLGLDLDLLLNGPKYISKVITNILNRCVQFILYNFNLGVLGFIRRRLLTRSILESP